MPYCIIAALEPWPSLCVASSGALSYMRWLPCAPAPLCQGAAFSVEGMGGGAHGHHGGAPAVEFDVEEVKNDNDVQDPLVVVVHAVAPVVAAMVTLLG